MVTIGHAIVDVLAAVGDDVVAGHGLAKGTMTLVDDDRAEAIYRSFAERTAVSGGSAANTAVGLAALGTPTRFVGKVRDDELGDHFARDIRAAGVAFDVPHAAAGPGTGRCMIMVTSDAEKTMCTYLGIGDHVGTGDLDLDAIAAAEVVYLEGYLCGLPSTDATVELAIDVARRSGTDVALSLSDPYWVELHGRDLDGLLDRVDLLFANEAEALGMTGAADLDGALAALGRRCRTVAVTLGPAGVAVAHGGEVGRIPAEPVPHVVDTTGAGDLFAAGYLHGHVAGHDPLRCARLGTLTAAEVIGHLGARPGTPLAPLAARVAAEPVAASRPA